MLRTNDGSGARKILYLNGAAGISGDMFLGALSDVAASLDRDFSLTGLIKKTGLFESVHAELSVRKEARGGITGVKVDVTDLGGHGDHGHRHRNLSDILELLEGCRLPPAVRDMSALAFTLLAEAEAGVHGVTPEEIHFHEVGAADSVADIAGAMLLMDCLGWPEVISSPVNVGSGTVKCAHGVLPVPAPATALLLKGMKIFSSGVPIERTTPTGALLLRTLAGENAFRDLPAGRVLCVGAGLGSKDTPDIPNALEVMLIEPDGTGPGRFLRDEPSLVEANIDDMNPQDFAHVADKMLEQGALDVWRENILMKKGRLAVKLCCLCKSCDADRFAEAMLTHTTTLGARVTRTRRLFFDRETEEIMTSLGPVRVKSAILDGQAFKKNPEYDDMLKIASEKDLPLWSVRKTVERETGA
ncbi:MAG: nickel pincer cofactor biosynthesis protein LarC [Synergistaceae bacterium]|jgi:uncharacterized protein (TIGR00299 family) protein|nr:nickel pincer cofactor biosynthesis protein LarC [Synergistaceae bacterium]